MQIVFSLLDNNRKYLVTRIYRHLPVDLESFFEMSLPIKFVERDLDIKKSITITEFIFRGAILIAALIQFSRWTQSIRCPNPTLPTMEKILHKQAIGLHVNSRNSMIHIKMNIKTVTGVYMCMAREIWIRVSCGEKMTELVISLWRSILWNLTKWVKCRLCNIRYECLSIPLSESIRRIRQTTIFSLNTVHVNKCNEERQLTWEFTIIRCKNNVEENCVENPFYNIVTVCSIWNLDKIIKSSSS